MTGMSPENSEDAGPLPVDMAGQGRVGHGFGSLCPSVLGHTLGSCSNLSSGSPQL